MLRILFREGLEAVLLVASIASYLNKLGALRRLVDLYLGAAIAVVASGATAWLFNFLGDGASQAALQAITTPPTCPFLATSLFHHLPSLSYLTVARCNCYKA